MSFTVPNLPIDPSNLMSHCIGLLTENCERVTNGKVGDDKTFCMAVAAAEPSAAFVSFRRQQPSLPLTQNDNSVPSSLISAGQFGGSIAKFAKNAVTTATFVALMPPLNHFHKLALK